MKKIAPEANHPVQLFGTVVRELDDGLFLVECEGQPWKCRRAASCLLKPETGDTVLLAGDSARVFLLAVIEQADASMTHLEMPGDVLLSAAQGNVTVHSARQVNLQGENGLTVQTDQLSLRARQGDCVVDEMQYAGRELKGTVGVVRLIGQLCETVVDRVMQISRNVFRMVEQTDQARVGYLDYEAEELARVHAKTSIVTGEKLVKVDAAQIHVG
ncbi:MAG: DUF3540 domain-containing protein [Azoarcus sp.]|nr:DUF3540 domain-containing protein [Azoarcus sp.]